MAMARHEDALELLKQAVALLVGDVRAEIHEAIGQLKPGEAPSRGADRGAVNGRMRYGYVRFFFDHDSDREVDK